MKDFLFIDPNDNTKEIQVRTDCIGAGNNFSVMSIVGLNDPTISSAVKNVIIGNKILIGKYFTKKDFIDWAAAGSCSLLLQESNGSEFEVLNNASVAGDGFDYDFDFDFN